MSTRTVPPDFTGWVSTARMAEMLGILPITLTRYRSAQLRGPGERAYTMIVDMPEALAVADTPVLIWPVREMLAWNEGRRQRRSARQRGVDEGS